MSKKTIGGLRYNMMGLIAFGLPAFMALAQNAVYADQNVPDSVEVQVDVRENVQTDIPVFNGLDMDKGSAMEAETEEETEWIFYNIEENEDAQEEWMAIVTPYHFEFCLPNDWIKMDCSPEETEAGMVLKYVDPQQPSRLLELQVTEGEEDASGSAGDLCETLKNAYDQQEVQICRVACNMLDCVQILDEHNELMVLSFFGQSGNLYSLYLHGAKEDDFSKMTEIVLYSLRETSES